MAGRWKVRGVACVVASLMGVSEALAHVGPAPEAATAEPTPRDRFERGLEHYETRDYVGAIVEWTAAYERLDAPEQRGARRVLGLDLAQAHLRRYASDHDPQHLVQARPLLDDYVAWVDRPEHVLTEAEREDRPRAIEMLAFVDANTPVVRRPTLAIEPAIPTPAPQPVPEPAAAPRPTREIGLFAGGGTLLALAVGSAVGAAIEARAARDAAVDYERAQQDMVAHPGRPTDLDDIDERGRRANLGTLALSITTVVLGGVGLGLVITGGVRRHRRLQATPAVGPGYAGAQVRLRF